MVKNTQPVYIYIAIENGDLYWIYPLKVVIFHSYANVYQRVIYIYISLQSSINRGVSQPLLGGTEALGCSPMARKGKLCSAWRLEQRRRGCLTVMVVIVSICFLKYCVYIYNRNSYIYILNIIWIQYGYIVGITVEHN